MELVLIFVAVIYVIHLIVGSRLLKDISSIEKENSKPPPQPPIIIDKRPIIIVNPQPRQPTRYLPAPVDSNIFVSVIFKRNDTKSYDYFLGDNYDVRVGDFVVVYVHDKFSHSQKRKVAQVVFVSSPGDVSPYARSTVVEKSHYRKW